MVPLLADLTPPALKCVPRPRKAPGAHQAGSACGLHEGNSREAVLKLVPALLYLEPASNKSSLQCVLSPTSPWGSEHTAGMHPKKGDVLRTRPAAVVPCLVLPGLWCPSPRGRGQPAVARPRPRPAGSPPGEPPGCSAGLAGQVGGPPARPPAAGQHARG